GDAVPRRGAASNRPALRAVARPGGCQSRVRFGASAHADLRGAGRRHWRLLRRPVAGDRQLAAADPRPCWLRFPSHLLFASLDTPATAAGARELTFGKSLA